MDNEKPKDGVKTENKNQVTVKVERRGGSVVRCRIKRRTPISKLRKSMKQTPAQLEMEGEDTGDVSQQQTEVSTEKGTCYLTPELSSSTPCVSFIQSLGFNAICTLIDS
ncbi:small ubiquitin-related modifier 2-like [Mustela erminea]|uniref:small ubiquitin-related modifier 2-like n=1 Tax=Mustela erminea TaxID=36723 RepID=UPI001386654D|nr:small ubiquitin-related modifier 2-like [Mustela erminea]